VAFPRARPRAMVRSGEKCDGVRMGRGRRGLLDDLGVLPWPVGLAVGMLGFAFIRYGIPAWASDQSGPLGQALSRTDAFAPLAWIVLASCAMSSLLSWLDSRRKLDAQTGLASIAALGWRDFERLVGEAFRRQGYTVEESGLGRADGGIDLILRRDGQRTLVQCKQWRRRKVPVNVVREMYGLLAHHGAHAVQYFAAGKPIELIDGATLLLMLQAVQPDAVPGSRVEPVKHAAETGARSAPDCPGCGAQMVQRRNRRNSSLFWGCSTYPHCKSTR